jgi:hypothetical protein
LIDVNEEENSIEDDSQPEEEKEVVVIHKAKAMAPESERPLFMGNVRVPKTRARPVLAAVPETRVLVACTKVPEGNKLLRGKAATAAMRKVHVDENRRREEDARIRKLMQEKNIARWNLANFGPQIGAQINASEASERRMSELTAQMQEMRDDIEAIVGNRQQTERCEQCNQQIAGMFRARKTECVVCGIGICTRCARSGRCKKCGKEGESKQARERDEGYDSEAKNALLSIEDCVRPNTEAVAAFQTKVRKRDSQDQQGGQAKKPGMGE